MDSMLYAVLAALALGAVSTLGDFVWAALRLRHEMSYGLIHGAVICLCIGAVIGIRERRLAPALMAGPVIGLIAAAGFYVLAPWLRYSAMFPMWMLFWICFALLQEWLRAERGSGAVGAFLGRAVARGLVAAVLSGLAFYAISGIWTRPSPGGPNYLRNFLSWSVAFLPGFAALFIGRGTRRLPPGTTN
jgi:hypothetical protein